MSEPTRNPERRSSAAIWCVCGGFGLLVLGWAGYAALLSTSIAGDFEALAAIGWVGIVVGPILMGAGGVLSVIGLIWMVAQVFADTVGAKDRYSKDVER